METHHYLGTAWLPAAAPDEVEVLKTLHYATEQTVAVRGIEECALSVAIARGAYHLVEFLLEFPEID